MSSYHTRQVMRAIESTTNLLASIGNRCSGYPGLSTCWDWLGGTDGQGNPVMTLGGVTFRPDLAVWVVLFGHPGEGLHVTRDTTRCPTRGKGCVNPAHRKLIEAGVFVGDGVCPTPHKRGHATQAEAEGSIRPAMVEASGPLFTYRCRCRSWHLTRREQSELRANK